MGVMSTDLYGEGRKGGPSTGVVVVSESKAKLKINKPVKCMGIEGAS